MENMFQVASTKEWYATKGRHKVYAAGKHVEMPAPVADGAPRRKVHLPVVTGPQVTSPLLAMPGVRLTGVSEGSGCGSGSGCGTRAAR